MYIQFPGGSKIKSVPDIVDGSYEKPRRWSDKDNVYWDAIFTGGKDGTGSAGSKSVGDYLADVINSSLKVKVKVSEDLPEKVAGDAEDMNSHILVRLNQNNLSSDAKEMQLAMTLVHEFSHAHDFIKRSWDRWMDPYGFYYDTEERAYDREAQFAIEMETVDGKYTHGAYSEATRFTEELLRAHGSDAYKDRLEELSGRKSRY